MLKLFKNIISFLFKIERRKYKRIPCKAKAHWCLILPNDRDNCQHRGSSIITDINKEGLCCNDMHFFREDPNINLAINQLLTIYFALPVEDGSVHNFEIIGRIRSIKDKGNFGHSKRFGIQIHKMPRGDKKIFLHCIQILEKQDLENRLREQTKQPDQPQN